MRRFRRWEEALLREQYATTQNEAFAHVLARSVDSVSRKAFTMGLKKSPELVAALHQKLSERGRVSRFGAGIVPWNKGHKGYQPGGRCAQTQFKKGELAGNARRLWVPIGSYRINRDGNLDRKVADNGPPQDRWQPVHRLVWMERNGPIPEGCAIVFKPGRRSTELEAITPDALECITRQELMARNTVHRLPKDLALLVQLRGALNRQINRRIGDGQKANH